MIKILELFSGYGGAHFALKECKYDVECVGYSDIEKCANYIYTLNHGDNIKPLGDVTKLDANDLPDFDLLTGWDINVATKIFKQMFEGNKNKQKILGRFNI